MSKRTSVTEDRWRDGVKFLMGQGTGPALSPKDQRYLREYLRGPFANGMTEAQARAVLDEGMGWYKA